MKSDVSFRVDSELYVLHYFVGDVVEHEHSLTPKYTTIIAKNDSGDERSFQLFEELPARIGHKFIAIWAIKDGEESGSILIAINQSTGEKRKFIDRIDWIIVTARIELLISMKTFGFKSKYDHVNLSKRYLPYADLLRSRYFDRPTTVEKFMHHASLLIKYGLIVTLGVTVGVGASVISENVAVGVAVGVIVLAALLITSILEVSIRTKIKNNYIEIDKSLDELLSKLNAN